MALDEKRRQKASMKKKKKEKLRKKRRHETTFNAFGYAGYLYRKGLIKRAKEFPVFECLINPDWQEEGLARILLSRKQPNGKLVFGTFLVDLFCLGLKNTFCNADFSLDEYESSLKTKMYQDTSPITCHPLLASEIIFGAIEYARRLGFEPQQDFALSRFLLEEPSGKAPVFNVKFGKDGKPFYIAGPDDNIDYTVKKLSKSAGEGNFHFIVPLM